MAKYTLDEAARLLRLRECGTYGHEWEIVNGPSMLTRYTPVAIKCGRCGWFGRVEMGERPTEPTGGADA